MVTLFARQTQAKEKKKCLFLCIILFFSVYARERKMNTTGYYIFFSVGQKFFSQVRATLNTQKQETRI